MNTRVTCDLCKSEFTLTANRLKEEDIVLEKDGSQYPVKMTSLICPNCGKHYPVVIDDDATLPILSDVRACAVKRLRYLRKNKVVPVKLADKYRALNVKLGSKRRALAQELDGSFYQTEDGKEQLDYRYHEQ